MTICKFFSQGYCKFGNNCRFEHPSGGNNRNQSSNRFGAFGSGQSSGGNQNLADKYNITSDTIERDLSSETPQWILSAYAPGRDAPGQLFGGYPREMSFEELRMHYWEGKASGNEQQALSQAQDIYKVAQEQMQNALRNSAEAVQYIVSWESKHPNRHDICREGTQGAPFGEFLVGRRPKTLVPASNQSSPFGSNANTSSPFGAAPATTSAFGQPSALGQRPNPFGAPSQPAPGASPFGQASAPSAFGQPSQPTAAFGQPSQPTSAFGQPSALGAKPSPFGTASFGQPSQPNAQGNAFGQPSMLGQKPSPFGAAANTNTNASPFAAAGSNNNAAANPFGAPSNPQNIQSPFGSNTQSNNASSPFGQASQPAPNPFGQPAPPAAAASPFGSANQNQNASGNNPFGQQQPQAQNAFGTQNQQPASNPFGQPSTTSAPFGQPQNASAQQANPFGAPQGQQAPSNQTTQTANPYPPGSTRQHPPLESYASKGMDGRLANFKGKSVVYKGDKPGIREFDGTWRRIWFPNGPPPYSAATEMRPEQYDEKTKAQWMAFAQSGTFEGGVMPELPPPRECTLWDF